MKPFLTFLALLLAFTATAHAQATNPQNARTKARRYRAVGAVTPRHWSPGRSASPRRLNGRNQNVIRPKIRYKRYKLRVVNYQRQYGQVIRPGQNTPRYYGNRKPRKPQHTRYQTRRPQVRLRTVTPRFWNPSAGAARAGLR
ncbi:hypothetical protein [Rhodocaloribacter sp.]